MGKPPDFVGVGVQKAGTSWWYSLIAAHPGVVHDSGRPKELHFFDRYWNSDFTESDVDAYHELFSDGDRSLLAGEWTPRYMFDPWSLPLLRIAAPRTRVLALLRDPRDRYVTSLTQSIASGRDQPGPTLATDAFTRGLYAQQVSRVLESFPRAQVMLLQYERCVASPETQLALTYEFLGLDSAFRPDGLRDYVLKTNGPKAAVAAPLMSAITSAYRADVDQLASIAPEIDVALWTESWPDDTAS